MYQLQVTSIRPCLLLCVQIVNNINQYYVAAIVSYNCNVLIKFKQKNLTFNQEYCLITYCILTKNILRTTLQKQLEYCEKKKVFQIQKYKLLHLNNVYNLINTSYHHISSISRTIHNRLLVKQNLKRDIIVTEYCRYYTVPSLAYLFTRHSCKFHFILIN